MNFLKKLIFPEEVDIIEDVPIFELTIVDDFAEDELEVTLPVVEDFGVDELVT